MARAADTLVGRSTELAAVDSALAGLERGCFAALELAGEPGIGKTALLDELAARADARGRLVLAGRAAELERDLPFWTFADALDDYVHGLDPRGLAELSEEERAELAHVLPSLPGRPPHSRPTIASARTARCGGCWSCWRRPSRSCSCSTTSTGRTRARSSCSARCCAGRRPRRS